MDFIKIKVRGVIQNSGKLFLCKLAKEGFYCLPGGTFEKGEKLKECLEREFIEELGVKPVIGELITVHEFFIDEGGTCIDFWFKVENYNDFFDIDLKSTTHGFELSEVGFYDLDEITNYKPESLKEFKK